MYSLTTNTGPPCAAEKEQQKMRTLRQNAENQITLELAKEAKKMNAHVRPDGDVYWHECMGQRETTFTPEGQEIISILAVGTDDFGRRGMLSMIHGPSVAVRDLAGELRASISEISTGYFDDEELSEEEFIL